MNKLKGSLAAKIVAIALLAASCLALVGAVAGVAWLDSENAYQAADAQEMVGHLIENRLENAAYPLLNKAKYRPVRELYRDEPIRFELLDADENLLAGSLAADEQVQYVRTVRVSNWYEGLYFTAADEPLTAAGSYAVPIPTTMPQVQDETAVLPTPEPQPTPTPEPQEKTETAEPEGTRVVYVRMSWTDQSGDPGYDTQLLTRLFPYRYALIAAGIAALILAVLLFVFLMAAAGHRDETGEVKAGFVEKIPADLLWLLGLVGAWLLAILINETFNGHRFVSSILVAVIALVGIGLLALLCLMSTAVRLKLGTFLESCLVWRVLRWCWKWIKAAFRAVGRLLKGVPLVAKWIPAFLVLLLADLVVTMSVHRNENVLAFVKLVEWAILAAAILYLALCFKRLREGAKAIAAGEESVVIDEKYMVGDIKDHAEDLMHIRDGLSRAVDERMKSERLRTELITNVSHDIKTPLTSIINYVDLLSREEPENEQTKEYIEVLQRQSARLKKLTDDLVEASKASTGNLPVAPEKLELGVLLDQTAGEYGERLTEKQLELRVTKPEEPVYVQADPRHLWRILDNLMNNILKYAQPGTRVYLNLERENGKPTLSFRNISAQELNVRPEELTERFVRGDSARSTEGSGLGLAIAASLAKLQGIDMELAVDGDLFKVVLRFDEA